MKKLLCLFLAVFMLTAMLVACNDTQDNSEPPSDVSATTSAAESNDEQSVAGESSTDEYKPYGWDLPVKDLGGRVFKVLCRDYGAGSNSILGFNGEVIQRPDFDEKTADMVDIEKYNVRKEVEDKYNCTIEGDITEVKYSGLCDIIRKTVLVGEPHYDFFFDAYGWTNSLVTEGMLLDLFTVDTIDFSNPWWDQRAVADLSIANKLYFACGDINTYDNDGTWVMYFNKELAESVLPGTNLYELVENGEWTFDKLTEIVKTVSSDTDGVDGMSEHDTWGLGTETYNVFIHTLASGQKIVQKDADDIPYLSFRNETMYTVLGDIMDFYSQRDDVLIANYYTQYSNPWEETIIKAFREGRELFYMGGLINMVGFRTLEFRHGILPIPKHFADQDEYYHSVSYHNMSALSIPDVGAEDYSDLGLIIEALGAASKNKVTPVYYEKCMKSQYLPDEEDEAMLDLIFNSRCFDLGSVFNWGGIINQFTQIDGSFVARFESVETAVQAALDETLEYFRE